MNAPLDRIHCPLNGFGVILFPMIWKKGVKGNVRWFGKFDNAFKITDYNGFHNMYTTWKR